MNAASGRDEPDTGLVERAVWKCLEQVPDPEIPIVSIVDLGIVRGVRLRSDGVDVEVAPTYSGCPATEVIEQRVLDALQADGVAGARVVRVLSPPWTTDWISEAGRSKLLAYGIAPPAAGAGRRSVFAADRPLACPRCGSAETSCVSQFGSTACKASYKCDACLEPFEYFKCL
jgi:ring-1,2-phenylacetyl-CoA epoxidase subunit PaaD